MSESGKRRISSISPRRSRSPPRKRSRHESSSYRSERDIRDDHRSRSSREHRSSRDYSPRRDYDERSSSHRDRDRKRDKDKRDEVDYEDHERKHKHKDRKHKKDKKEKKKRKKEKKEKKRKLKELQKQAKRMLQADEPPRGSPPNLLLSVDENYYSHSKEFRFWLKQTNQSSWDELTNEEARGLFATFTEVWNKGDLSERYYAGNLQNSLSGSSWVTGGDTKKDRFDEESLFNRNITRKENTGGEIQRRPDRYEEEQRWERLRAERKKFHKTNDFVAEELVPKAVGREAMIEKKKQRAAYTKAEKETDRSYSDDFLMGDSTSEYQRMLQRSKQRNSAKVERQQEQTAKKQELRDKYRAKEEALMQSFRSVVAKGDIPLMKFQSNNQ